MTPACAVTGCTRPGHGLCKPHIAGLVDALYRLAGGGVLRTRVHYRHDYGRDPLAVACPDCFRGIGTSCVDRTTGRPVAGGSHPQRRRRASEIATTRVDTRAGLYEDLVDQVARKDHLGGEGIPTVTAHSGLGIPLGEAAAAVRDQVDAALSYWAHEIARVNGRQLSARTVRDAARWLAAHPDLLARHTDAGKLHDQITKLVWLVERVIDEADKVYLGRCDPANPYEPCTRDIYALPSRSIVQCPDCGTSWDVRARRDHLLATVDHQLAPAGEIARALTQLGRKLTASMIRGYHYRGRIRQYPPHPLDPHRRLRYHVGEVRDVIDSIDDEKEAM